MMRLEQGRLGCKLFQSKKYIEWGLSFTHLIRNGLFRWRDNEDEIYTVHYSWVDLLNYLNDYLHT